MVYLIQIVIIGERITIGSFYNIGKNNPSEVSKIISTRDDSFPKKSPTGIYDQIVCLECERFFGPWDDYAFAFFRGLPTEPANTNKDVLIINKYNYAELKLFFLSLIWRSGVSNQTELQPVSLGHHESQIRKMILAGDPGTPDDYSIFIVKYKLPLETVPILTPYKSVIDEIITYKVSLGGCSITIKVDSKNFEEPLRSFAISPVRPPYIFLIKYEGSQEQKSMQKMIKKLDKPLFP